MYCLEELNEENQEETAEHFATWCAVMPSHLKREARLQWNYVKKLVKAGWYEEGLGLNPPSLLDDALPGDEKKKRKKRKPI